MRKTQYLHLILALFLSFLSFSAYRGPQEIEKDRNKAERPQLENYEVVQAADKEKSDQQKRGGFRIGVDVNQVVVNVTVHDRNGSLISGLKQENFQIYEDKVLQMVTNFGQVDLPATVGLVMDNSGSMKKKIDLVGKAAKQFVDKSNPDNE